MVNIKRLLKSFTYAFRGLARTFREEQNLQIQLTIGILVVISAAYFRLGRLEWAIILFTILLVILMEIANSAVERVADVLKPRIDNYVKEIKDIMAAAVMLASIIAVVIGLIIFWPHLFK